MLVAGYAEATTSEVIYDSAAVFERDGTPLLSYRKTHCLDTERRYFFNGDELPLIDSSVGRLGVMICWDAAFPEVARTHALAGADLLVVIGAWEDPHVPDWDLVMRARAYDNVTPSWPSIAPAPTATRISPAIPACSTVSADRSPRWARKRMVCSSRGSTSSRHGR